MNQQSAQDAVATAAFRELTPDALINAVERVGYRCDGRLLALNSYENRVYQVGIEQQAPLIAKFYRPGRWSDAAILEEHAFAAELAEAEIPVIAPLANEYGQTLHHQDSFRFALFPRYGGHAPELGHPQHLEALGRLIARIHLIGACKPFKHRPVLDMISYGYEPARFLLENEHYIPAELKPAYQAITGQLLAEVEAQLNSLQDVTHLRIHADCHVGNILWRDDRVHIVDLDDTRSGPAVQDIWLFLSGDRVHQTARLADLLEGYTQFRDFDPRELTLIEPLRALRMLHYAAWLARRWDDPAFPLAFPWFNTGRYWEEHILQLREQRAALDEPALVWS